MGSGKRRAGEMRRLSNAEGSMTVEAAAILPFILLFVMFLIFMIRITIYSTALQATVSDAAKIVSSHIYPVYLSLSEEEAGGESAGGWSMPRVSVEKWLEEYADRLPAPLSEWAKDAIEEGEGQLQRLQAEASEAVLDELLKPLLKPYLASGALDYERVHISNVLIPNLKTGVQPYFSLTASYELPMKIPFVNRPIVVEASASERLWIGDSGGDTDGSGEDDDEGGIVILEKPDPGIANKQGKVRARIAPGMSASLTVYYKTGRSTARHLGWKIADEEGYIEWEWKIGVNTTPGEWPFVIETADRQSIEVYFTVIK